MSIERRQLISPLLTLCKQAGEAILECYDKPGEVLFDLKADATPVTKADIRAHNIIRKGLAQLTPDIPVISEEAASVDYTERQKWHKFWLVDPLDGTKEFIHRTNEFTVNIALIEDHRTVMGFVYAPVFDLYYYASLGEGAYKIEAGEVPLRINTRKTPADDIIIAVSRRHSQERVSHFLAQFNSVRVLHKGSSLKSCLVAEGLADLYPCFGPTSEWDIAASQCVVEEAGGVVVDKDLQPMRYNTRLTLLNPPLLIMGDAQFDWGNFLNLKE